MMKGPALHAMLAAVLLALLATCGAARASNSRGHGDYERAHTVRVPLCIPKMRDCRCSDNPNCNIQTFMRALGLGPMSHTLPCLPLSSSYGVGHLLVR